MGSDRDTVADTGVVIVFEGDGLRERVLDTLGVIELLTCAEGVNVGDVLADEVLSWVPPDCDTLLEEVWATDSLGVDDASDVSDGDADTVVEC